MSATPSPSWPLTGLVLRAGEITLTPLIEAELDDFGDAISADVELDPGTPRPFGLDEAVARTTQLRQEYWRGLGRWSPDDWNLTFVVRTAGRMIGAQTLEAKDFDVLRTVETASWLRADVRGKGFAKLSRTAVLSLAFDQLGATTAITEAWADNSASLGVSRSLGYQPNGSARHRRGDVADEMPRLRLDIAGWQSRPRPEVEVEGLEPCLRWFSKRAAQL